MSSPSSSLSPNALVLVTGSGGYLGSAISWQLLKKGFKVRGTTRTASKLRLFKEKAETEFGQGKFEIAEIADLSVKGALDSALKDVEGVINVASDSSFGDDLKIVESVVSLNEEVLASVKAAGTVKSFVITSSRVASFHPDATSSYEIDDSNWFDEAYGLAEKSQDSLKPFLIYAASKVAGERRFGASLRRRRVNSTLPTLVFGKIFNPAPGNYSTGSGLINFADEKPGVLKAFFGNPVWFVDVEDTAKLHVAALVDETVDRQRLWAASSPYSAVALQEAVRAFKKNFKAGEDLSVYPGLRQNISIDNKVSIDLLQKHYQHGFKNLEESVKTTLE